MFLFYTHFLTSIFSNSNKRVSVFLLIVLTLLHNNHQHTPPNSQFFWTLIMGCLHQIKKHQVPITILLKIHALENSHQRKSNGNSGTNTLCHKMFISSEHIYTQYIKLHLVLDNSHTILLGLRIGNKPTRWRKIY